MSDYQRWCLENGCSHGHCQYDCEHPQPFELHGKLWCGRCWFIDRLMTEMVPCGPEDCE